MSVNKVQLANGETIIDISDSTVTPETLAEGVTAHDASGRKITGKMIPGGGSSVQSDWNQTDSSAADFIKNKPFGDFQTVLYEGTDLAPEFADGFYSLEISADFSFIDGQQYTVVLDGVEYVSDTLLYYGMPVIGNLMFMGGEDNGLPFFSIIDGGTLLFGAVASFSSLSISTVEPKKIDEKYITAEAVILYVSSKDNYLYKNIETSESDRLTLSELRTYSLSGRKIYVYTSAIYNTPVQILLFGTYGFVSIVVPQSTFETQDYYTAEYTPPTT